MNMSFDSSLLLQVKKIQVPEIRFGSCQKVKRTRLKRIDDQTVLNTEKAPRTSNSPRLYTETIFSTQNKKLKMRIPTIDLVNSFNTTLVNSQPKRRLQSRNRCQSPKDEYPKFRIPDQSTNYNHYLYQIFSFSPKKVLTSLQSSQQYTKPRSLDQISRSINQSLVYSYPKNCKF